MNGLRGNRLPLMHPVTIGSLGKCRETVKAFLPDSDMGAEVSPNRLKREAEAWALIRGLPDRRLEIALVQLKALAEIK